MRPLFQTALAGLMAYESLIHGDIPHTHQDSEVPPAREVRQPVLTATTTPAPKPVAGHSLHGVTGTGTSYGSIV